MTFSKFCIIFTVVIILMADQSEAGVNISFFSTEKYAIIGQRFVLTAVLGNTPEEFNTTFYHESQYARMLINSWGCYEDRKLSKKGYRVRCYENKYYFVMNQVGPGDGGWWNCTVQDLSGLVIAAATTEVVVYEANISLSTESPELVSRQTLTLTCELNMVSGLKAEVQFLKIANESSNIVGSLSQDVSECALIDDTAKGYSTKCGSGSNDMSDRKIYIMGIDEVSSADSADWLCQVKNKKTGYAQKSNTITVSVNQTDCDDCMRGPGCSADCEDQWYGQYCQYKCNCKNKAEVCHKKTGQCVSGCPERWIGYACDVCEDSRYGDRCENKCHCRSESEVCHKKTGKCLTGCPDGWIGDGCNKKCDDYWYGYNCQKQCHCKDEPCDRATGKCEFGCAERWAGRYCDRCISFRYGPECNRTCKCSGGSCLQNTGECTQGCDANWSGRFCDECLPFWYGSDCEKRCHCKKGACNNVTGECTLSCKRGWTGENCDMCDDFFYGRNCELDCHCRDTTCNNVTGDCPSGCKRGWSGSACDHAVRQVKVEDTPAPAMSVGVTALVVVVAVVAVAVIGVILSAFWNLKRRKGHSDDKDTLKREF
ncbi:multiple epidermal growth factor-like domains protein 10 [Gigantopelta aegis]|uniref:multiple epidermal growth factor-like domains protein 10 n=1 Tax=Gigantopelta aegis TaxID=1735272 RepID=UPI001B88A800|nr:multiple epidermal growth factor-like domains protein 10 [Gigantopelta aegis]